MITPILLACWLEPADQSSRGPTKKLAAYVVLSSLVVLYQKTQKTTNHDDILYFYVLCTSLLWLYRAATYVSLFDK
jgi:hypothetical protein